MSDFITDFLLEFTSEPIYVCSLPNVKGEGLSERHVLTRDPQKIRNFVSKWDQSGRGMFFCVGAVAAGKKRNKENIREVYFLHEDLDFKNILGSPEAALDVLVNMDYPPSRIHRSGNGLHAYWLLDETYGPDSFDRIESVLKKLRDVVGGDPTVNHVAALMRFPGSHNTKNGAWTEVETIRDTGEVYSLTRLEAYAARTSALIQRRPTEGPATETNAFLRIAGEIGFRPPINVEARLAAMEHGGAGENAIHQTQLSVTAALLSAGEDVEDVVERVLEATRAVGHESWNWVQEERTIRGMCTDWIRKHAPSSSRKGGKLRDDQTIEDTAVNSSRSVAPVVSLAAARKDKEKKPKKEQAHVALGMGIMLRLREAGQAILLTREQLWRYEGGIWSVMTTGEAKNWIASEVEVGCRSLDVVSTQKIANETYAWLCRNPEVYRPDVEWDAHGKISTKSGLLDPDTLEVTPLAPEHYATHRVDCEFDPTATCPWWETMMNDVFGDRLGPLRRDTIGLLQEVLGAALLESKPRALMRALVLYGPSGTGKSVVVNAMAGLVSDNINATPFDALENAHGLGAFLRRAPWVLHEAFDQGKWHFSATAKALLSGDDVNVNVKNGPMLTLRFKNPVFWATNSPPQFKEATKAMVNRMLVLGCNRVFDRPVGAAAEAYRSGYASAAEMILDREKPGLLNWAIVGMKRARALGHFNVTEEVTAALEQIRMDSNIVSGFIEECVEFDEHSSVRTPDFCASFATWWAANRGQQGVPSNDSIGRAVRSLSDPRIGHANNNGARLFTGIKLNEDGIDYWRGVQASNLAAGRASRLSNSEQEVNRTRTS